MEDVNTRVGIVMSIEMRNDMRELAKKKGLDMSSYIRMLLSNEIEKEKEKDKKK